MEESKHEEEVVLEEEQDELDSWFDTAEEEEDEDLSAEEDAEDSEDSSPEEEEEEPDPDTEDLSDDAEESASEEGSSTESSSSDDPYEWMARLDPDLKKEVERLVQSDRSQKGRVAALQRRLDSVQAEQEARARTQPVTAAKELAAKQGKDLEDMDDEELAEFMEEFPSVAKNVQKLIDKRVQEEISQRVQPIEQERLQARIEQDRQALRQEAQRIFNTVETGIELDDVTSSVAFREWLAYQPEGYQQFAKTADTVRDAAKVLEDFAIYTEAEVARMMAEDGTPPEEQTQQETSRSADQTAARRKQARQGATPKSKSAQLRNKPGQGTYEDWFEHFVEEGS